MGAPRSIPACNARMEEEMSECQQNERQMHDRKMDQMHAKIEFQVTERFDVQ